MNNQVMRRLEALEESMGTGEGTRPEIELVFVEAQDGRPTGKVTYVKLSELTKATSTEG